MKLSHVSINAQNADALAEFYRNVFGFIDRRPPRWLTGEKVSRGNGLPGSKIYSIWLNFPGTRESFLEILSFEKPVNREASAVNASGYAHIAFEVSDLKKTVTTVLKSGGSLQGEITNFGTEAKPHLIIYVRDPEGNVLELEQPFLST